MANPDFSEVYSLRRGDYLIDNKENTIYIIEHISYIRNRPYYFTLVDPISTRPYRVSKFNLLKSENRFSKLLDDDPRIRSIRILYGK